jgi:hypothetical protein
MRTVLYGLILLGVSVPVWAHHSFAAEFDEKKPITVRGKVTEWELINPHSWIHLDVKGVPWMIEGGSPNALLRLGFTKDSLPPGTEIMVEGFQSKDGTNRAVGTKLTFADGKKLFMGGSAPGANP